VRVLTVGNSFPPQEFGGGYEAVWEGAVRHLEAGGHTVRVLTVDRIERPGAPEIADAHRTLRWYWRDHGFPALSLRESLAIERHNLALLREQLVNFRPDVVSWWSMGGMTLSLLEATRRAGIPAVAFVHDDWLDYGRRADLWHRRARRRRVPPVVLDKLLRVPGRIDFGRAAHYAFVSNATRAHAQRGGLDLPDTSILHSGIAAGFEPAPERDWQGRLLYVGRIDPRKGVDKPIRALPELPEVALEIVGGGPQADVDDLVELARSLGVEDRVTFTGPVEPADLPERYAAADAVVFPVLWSEPWGLVPLEAMAMGRPVIATGRGGSAEYLVDGQNALLYDGDDVAGLADRVRRVARDEGLRSHLRANGFETASRHTAKHFEDGVERTLCQRLS
jgi:glycosyltransferase involved in cell wall biosynthesis